MWLVFRDSGWCRRGFNPGLFHADGGPVFQTKTGVGGDIHRERKWTRNRRDVHFHQRCYKVGNLTAKVFRAIYNTTPHIEPTLTV